MGQNSDIHNIFESYSDRVLLKEQQPGVDNIPQLKNRLKTIRDEEDRKRLEDQIPELEKAHTSSNNAAPQPVASVTPASTAPTNTEPVRLSRSPAPKPTTPQQAPVADVSKSTSNPYAKKVAQPASPTPQPAAGGTPPSASALSAEKQKMAEMRAAIGAGDQEKASKLFDELGKIRTDDNLPNQPIDGLKQNPQPGDATSSTPDAPRNLGVPAYDDAAKKQNAKPADSKGGKPSGTSGGSIVDYLAGKNQKFDRASRAKLAAEKGIENYTGTAEQNTQLLKKLQSGEKPTAGQRPSKATPAPQTTQPSAGAQQPQQEPRELGGLAGLTSDAIAAGGNLAKKALVGDRPIGGLFGLASNAIGTGGNMIKKALIGGGQKQAPAQQTTPVQKQAPTKQQTPPKKATGLAADKYVEDEEIQENKNIAKFVKCLSEKNYSQAHEYLKKVLNAKVEKNLHKVVNKI